MHQTSEVFPLEAFANAASRVPAYQSLLREAGIEPAKIQSAEQFRGLPILEKQTTFQRFAIEQLCLDGKLGRLATVLTSSGHSGIFAFGLSDAQSIGGMTKWVDDLLDLLFAVRSKSTLLINCLPMGVKVPTLACTLAETSVRPDMAVGLIKSFGGHFAQNLLIGEAAFIKHVLETGIRKGLNWRDHVVHVILGEEPLAENARHYLGDILGHDLQRPEKGMIVSSMGIAEIGLNLFFEVPPLAPLVFLRRAMHDDRDLREAILGPADSVPSLFTYDPSRIFVEFDDSGRLILTTLDLTTRIPLIRYASGDRGAFVDIRPEVRPALEAHNISWELLESIPMVLIAGRGEHASAPGTRVYPEQVKEGIYHDPTLAKLATANFRLISDPVAVQIRIQLSPTIKPSPDLDAAFRAAISHYVGGSFDVTCREYETFRDGMALDYERKFRYVAN